MDDGTDEATGMDLQQASALMHETGDRARRALVVRPPSPAGRLGSGLVGFRWRDLVVGPRAAAL
jgi:hypothetical protein